MRVSIWCDSHEMFTCTEYFHAQLHQIRRRVMQQTCYHPSLLLQPWTEVHSNLADPSSSDVLAVSMSSLRGFTAGYLTVQCFVRPLCLLLGDFGWVWKLDSFLLLVRRLFFSFLFFKALTVQLWKQEVLGALNMSKPMHTNTSRLWEKTLSAVLEVSFLKTWH